MCAHVRHHTLSLVEQLQRCMSSTRKRKSFDTSFKLKAVQSAEKIPKKRQQESMEWTPGLKTGPGLYFVIGCKYPRRLNEAGLYSTVGVIYSVFMSAIVCLRISQSSVIFHILNLWLLPFNKLCTLISFSTYVSVSSLKRLLSGQLGTELLPVSLVCP